MDGTGGVNQPFNPQAFFVPPEYQAISYVITVPDTPGSYVFTGTSATLNVGIAPASGSYAVSGTSATLGVAIVPAGGVYSVTGTGANFDTGISLSGGSYSFTGTGPTLDVGLFPASGAYVFTGAAATFTRSLHLIPVGGVYSFAGTIVTLLQAAANNLNLTYWGGCPYITEDASADYTQSGTAIDQDIYYRQEEG